MSSTSGSDWELLQNSSSEHLNLTKVNMNQTTDQQINGLRNEKDQQKDSKDENPINMNQKDQQKELKNEKVQQINKLNDLVYDLECSKRDELVLLLNQYSSNIWLKSKDGKEKLMEKNLNLYCHLINLPLKSNDTSNIEQNQLVLELDYDEKSKVLQCLIDNQNSTVLSDACLTNEIKLNLIDQNNNLIMNLLKLPVRIIEANQIADLNSNGNSLSKDYDIQKKINFVDERLNGLEEKLNSIKQKIDLNADEAKTECTFEFDNIKEFIDSGLDEKKSSTPFICKSISWDIRLYKEEIDGLKYLALYLFSDLKNCDGSIDTNYKFTLLNQSDKEDKCESFEYKFEIKDNFGWGGQFINLDDLQKEGFIEENKIKIKIELKINKIIIH